MPIRGNHHIGMLFDIGLIAFGCLQLEMKSATEALLSHTVQILMESVPFIDSLKAVHVR